MKNLIKIFAVVIVIMTMTFSIFAVDKLVIGDTAKPGQFKVMGPLVASDGRVTFTNGINSVVGSNVFAVASILNVIGVTNFQGSTNLFAPYLIQAVTNSAGAADSGKLAKLNGSGQFDPSFLPGFPTVTNSSYLATNVASHVGSGSPNTFTTVVTLTTTATTGTVIIVGRAATASTAANIQLKLYDTANTVHSYQDSFGANNGRAASLTVQDKLIGVAKTYNLDVASDAGSTVYTNNFAAQTGHAAVTNALGISLIQVP